MILRTGSQRFIFDNVWGFTKNRLSDKYSRALLTHNLLIIVFFSFFNFVVIIMLIPRDELRKYMLQANMLGMTNGDYQFLFTDTKVVYQHGLIFKIVKL